jgi:hypothetical protein
MEAAAMGLQRIKPNYRRRVLRLPIWTIANWQCSPASARQPRAASMSTPSTNSSPGTARSLGWPSTASSSCAIACTWNRGIWAANTINQQLAAVRRLAHEAADAGLLSPELATGTGAKPELVHPFHSADFFNNRRLVSTIDQYHRLLLFDLEVWATKAADRSCTNRKGPLFTFLDKIHDSLTA